MTYKEAQKYSLSVLWKTTECHTKDCWCEIIEPEVPIKDDDGNEIYIAGSGCVPKLYARHIVKLHNISICQS